MKWIFATIAIVSFVFASAVASAGSPAASVIARVADEIQRRGGCIIRGDSALKFSPSVASDNAGDDDDITVRGVLEIDENEPITGVILPKDADDALFARIGVFPDIREISAVGRRPRTSRQERLRLQISLLGE